MHRLVRPQRRLAGSFVSTCLLVLGSYPCVAYAQSPPQPPSNNYGALFPNPTGHNGYEDFVLAGDALKNSPAWQAYEEGKDQTLAWKRRVLWDPAVKGALAALRTGLLKPVRSPHEKLEMETRTPELASFRPLARLLYVEMYVALADGRVGDAVSTLGDGLQLGYALQTDSLLSGLVGIAVDGTVLRQFGDHLDQMSARDCDRLLQLARKWLALPDPSAKILDAERALLLDTLKRYRSRPVELLKQMTQPKGGSIVETPEGAALAQLFQQDPNAAGSAFDQTSAMVNAQYQHAVDSQRLPVWERKPWSPTASLGQAAQKLATFVQSPDLLPRVSSRYDRDLAIVQMLGVHAAIRRFRWDHDRLPASLDELALGRLAVDPFSGKPFQYRALDVFRYELSSIGPFDAGTADTPPAGSRVPISLPLPRP